MKPYTSTIGGQMLSVAIETCHCQKCDDTHFALFGNVRYISITRISCFTTGAYGGSNSDFMQQ